MDALERTYSVYDETCALTDPSSSPFLKFFFILEENSMETIALWASIRVYNCGDQLLYRLTTQLWSALCMRESHGRHPADYFLIHAKILRLVRIKLRFSIWRKLVGDPMLTEDTATTFEVKSRFFISFIKDRTFWIPINNHEVVVLYDDEVVSTDAFEWELCHGHRERWCWCCSFTWRCRCPYSS